MANFSSHYSRSLPENDWQPLRIGLVVEVQRKGEQGVKKVKQEVEKVEREEEKEVEEEEKKEVWRLERETEDALGMC